MAYIRENGVHKDDKDKQWSASLRDFALDVMKLTFAINSAAASEGNKRDEKWIELYRRTTVRARALNPTFPTEKERFRISTRGIPHRLASKFGDISRSVRSSIRKPWSRKVSAKRRSFDAQGDRRRRMTTFQIDDEIIV
ncbi:unnamed protein product [Oikopleura dioica]|nr:unnamed protein product [Oikopleura dioica]